MGWRVNVVTEQGRVVCFLGPYETLEQAEEVAESFGDVAEIEEER